MRLPYFRLVKGILKNKIGVQAPLTLAYEATVACNLRCRFCSFWKRQRGDELELSEVRDAIAQAVSEGASFFAATGGEPLLREDIPQILKFARKRMLTLLVTNGVLLAERIDEIAPFLDFLTVSLDTLNPSKYKYLRGCDCLEDVLEGISAYEERRKKYPHLKFNINTVLMRETLPEVPYLLNFALKKRIGITFEPVVPLTSDASCENPPEWGSPEDFNNALKEILRFKARHPATVWNTDYYLKWILERKNFICRSETLIRMDACGNIIAPCYDHPSYDVVGNIREKRLSEILHSKKARELHESAHKCPRKDCYLMCYVEPSLVISSFSLAFRGLASMFMKLRA